jgi:putative sigma-54 modulation protein
MEIAIRARHVGWNDELRQQVERSIDFAVDRHRGRIDRISVYLSDLNGPRGGVDKLCQITADLRGTRPVLILERGKGLLAVVNRAARRLGYRIGRNIHRRRASGAPEYRATIRAV